MLAGVGPGRLIVVGRRGIGSAEKAGRTVKIAEAGNALDKDLGLSNRRLRRLEGQVPVARVAGHFFLESGTAHAADGQQRDDQQDNQADSQHGPALTAASRHTVATETLQCLTHDGLYILLRMLTVLV